MPKVLRILNRLNLGGPTYNATYLTKFLEPEFETKLVVGAIDASEASSRHIAESLGIVPHYLPEMQREISPLKDRKAYLKLKEIIKEFKPDIVHTHAAKSGALGRLAASNLGVPVILHTFHGHVFHSYFNPIKTKAFIRIEKHLATKSTRIIAISPLQKKELAEDFQICEPDKIEIVRLGFDLDRFSTDQTTKRASFRETYQIAEDEIAIGIIGRLVPVKNHGFFLRIVKEVLEKTTKKVKFLIVGDGEERSNIEAFAENIKKQANIPTSAVGLITTAAEAENILNKDQADLIFIGREFLRNPYFPLEAAKVLGDDVEWAEQYGRGR